MTGFPIQALRTVAAVIDHMGLIRATQIVEKERQEQLVAAHRARLDALEEQAILCGATCCNTLSVHRKTNVHVLPASCTMRSRSCCQPSRSSWAHYEAHCSARIQPAESTTCKVLAAR